MYCKNILCNMKILCNNTTFFIQFLQYENYDTLPMVVSGLLKGAVSRREHREIATL